MSNKIILIVEDDPMIADALSDIVTVLGYTSVWAGTGDDALQLLEVYDDPFDLAILDLELPGLSGTETAKKLKELIPDIKIIFSTGYSDQEDNIDTNDPNVFGIIRKPFELDDIKAAIEKVLPCH